MISVIGAPVVKSVLGPSVRIRDFTTGGLLLKSRPKIQSFKIDRNHLETTQEHPRGVFDDSGAVFRTPRARSNLVSLVKR